MGIVRDKYLILEQSEVVLKATSEKYVFVGVCADFNVNENNRVYDRDDYLSHLTYLKEEIAAGTLLGELDHPEEGFMVSMKNVSHKILDLWYDEASDTVKIKIQLLNTASGRDAMAVADSGTPIRISSRAAGYIERGLVSLDRIYTYDIVYEPGFKNATLVRVDESLTGFNSNRVAIYEFNSFKKNKMGRANPSVLGRNRRQRATNNDDKMQSYLNLMSETINEHTRLLESSGGSKTSSPRLKILERKLERLIKYSNEQSNTINEQSVQIDKLIKFGDLIGGQVNENSSLGKKMVAFTNHIATTVNEANVNAATRASKLKRLVEYSNMIATATNTIMEGKDKKPFDWKKKAGIKEEKEGGDDVEKQLDEIEAEIEELEAADEVDQDAVDDLKAEIDELESEDVSERRRIRRANGRIRRLHESINKRRPARRSRGNRRMNESVSINRSLTQIERSGRVDINEVRAVKRQIRSFEISGRSDSKEIRTLKSRVSRIMESVKPNRNKRKPAPILESVKQRRLNRLNKVRTNSAKAINEAKLKRAYEAKGRLEGEFPFITNISESSRRVFEGFNQTTRGMVRANLAKHVGKITHAVTEAAIADIERIAPTLSIIDKIPTDLQPIWESMTPKAKESAISASRLRRLGNDYAIGMFWRSILESRGTHGVTRLNENRGVNKQNYQISELGYGDNDIKKWIS